VQEEEKEQSISKSVVATIAAISLAVAAGGGMAWLGMKNNQPQIAEPNQTTSPNTAAIVDPTPPPPTDPGVNQTDTSPTTDNNKVKVYGVDESDGKIRIISEDRRIASGGNATPSNFVKQSLTTLLASAKIGKEGKQLSSIPKSTKLLSSNVKPNGIYINLSKEFMEGGGSSSMQARLAQIIYTATERNPNAQVWISVEGKKLESLGGEGIEVRQPITRKSFQQDFKESVGEH
jgi:spore germination protein GerM